MSSCKDFRQLGNEGPGFGDLGGCSAVDFGSSSSHLRAAASQAARAPPELRGGLGRGTVCSAEHRP